jgi:uncharacterized membrane protein
MRTMFWLCTAAVLGLAVHILTLLYAPPLSFKRSLERQLTDSPRNAFAVLTPEAQAALLPDFPPGSVFGVCRYDLATGPVILEASFPAMFWTLTVYASDGRTIYAATDRQSGIDSVRLRLVKAPGIADILIAKEEDDAIETSAWKVPSSKKTGLAVLWVPTADPAMRGVAAAALAKSRCATERQLNAKTN